jgi:putative addiction module component (TIGR02574 family)
LCSTAFVAPKGAYFPVGDRLGFGDRGQPVPGCAPLRYRSCMGAEVLRLYEAVMQLSEADRAELLAMLLDSEGDGSTQDELDAAWGAEARRRMDDIATGCVRTIPLEDVLREGRDMIEQTKRARLG